MDEEFSYIEPNQSYPSAFSSGSFNAAKGDEERSDSYEVAKRLQRREGGLAAHAEWPLNGLVERPVRASGQR